MIVLNGVDATSVIFLAGLYYVASGLYFRVPVAVQPMKVIAAYAIAIGLTPQQIAASGLWMSALLVLLGWTNLISIIRRFVPHSSIRGVQLALGAVLMTKGLRMMIETDPNLTIARVGPVPMGLLLGTVGMVITLMLIHNRRVPAALVIVLMGGVAGLLLGRPVDAAGLSLGLHLPRPLPYGVPSWGDFLWALPVLALPQLPMTVGNAIYSNTDLTRDYFPNRSARMTNRASTLSQGLANAVLFFFGGIPMCHGAGGLAAHYRFGARTAGCNLIIGGILALLALLLGKSIVPVLGVIPLAVLGVLLLFAGLQLALMIEDLKSRADLFVAMLILGLTLAFNLAVAFFAGVAIAWILRSGKIEV
jgi:SulP family sulfate permease